MSNKCLYLFACIVKHLFICSAHEFESVWLTRCAEGYFVEILSMQVNVPMGLVVKRTGLSPHVIRIWERRYQAVSPARTDGGHRSYLEEDVLRLILLRQLTEAGHKISSIAKLTTAELEEISG